MNFDTTRLEREIRSRLAIEFNPKIIITKEHDQVIVVVSFPVHEREYQIKERVSREFVGRFWGDPYVLLAGVFVEKIREIVISLYVPRN